ncbi:uncharacterized protein KY384_008494 [Bacidia gigantensis]|uniref:uncharacterized protein n=1 Tax=Bacidia gigantensis TaxID=2732470 RepID=UPI001D0366D2|nr:uncharacterized protein KY384_008494 [Bacidia gigantensis]KAG8527065.1 hypothetical protein KY384_008494 [Bacidia gigantensis]
MSASSNIVRRALLYVPASSPKMLAKSSSLAVDCVAFDLEDSVTIDKKPEARANLQRLLAKPVGGNMKDCAVRINAIGSGLAEEDLAAVCGAPSLDTLVIPKVNSASDLHWAADFIQQHRTANSADGSALKPVTILALIESARAIVDLQQICTATPLLSGLIFAAEDFAQDLSLTRTPSLTEFLYARSAVVTAARAHNLRSTIDLVCTDFRGDDGTRKMQEECLNGKGLGFNGKQCIHPSQIDIAQRCFAPGEEELEWAVRILIADEKATKMGKGAWALDGKMIDVPVVKKAKALVERAAACDIDVGGKRKQWGTQEPE